MSNEEINWYTVEKIQEKSFHGHSITPEEQRLCTRALNADPARYAANGKRVREEYSASLRMG